MDPFDPIEDKSEEDQARIRARIMQLWFKPTIDHNKNLTTL